MTPGGSEGGSGGGDGYDSDLDPNNEPPLLLDDLIPEGLGRVRTEPTRVCSRAGCGAVVHEACALFAAAMRLLAV